MPPLLDSLYLRLLAAFATMLTMVELPPMPATWPEQRIYIGKVNGIGCRHLITDVLNDKPATPFHFTLGRLIEKVEQDNKVLGFDDEATIPQIAWATRNLIEIQILIRYVCQSQANLERFNNDFFTNGASTIQAQLRLLNDFAKRIPDPMRAKPEQYRELDSMQQAREEVGLGNEGPLMARTLAGKVGLEKQYLAFSSVTSTLIHPTALSVLRTFDLEVYRPGLIGQGLVIAGDAIVDARGHVDKHGFKPEK
jgi:hypothetical protein